MLEFSYMDLVKMPCRWKKIGERLYNILQCMECFLFKQLLLHHPLLMI